MKVTYSYTFELSDVGELRDLLRELDEHEVPDGASVRVLGSGGRPGPKGQPVSRVIVERNPS